MLARRVGSVLMALTLGTAAAPVAALPFTFAPPVARPAFGAAQRVDNVAVYPITLATQDDIGPIVSLEEALAKGQAEVREVGTSGGPEAPNPARTNEPVQVQIEQVGPGGGATVNTLVIENKGDVPVFVLAGTVVKGGNQDRQIGQDFIVDAKQVVPVDAFCVERGRWAGAREGQATDGRFEAAKTLALSKVRIAGQHKKDQGEVWSKVAEANAANGKESGSGTLLATLDAHDVAARTEALAAKIQAALAGAPAAELVGFAYAVDGQVRGARWFTSHRLFAMYQDKLVRTAAVDALTLAAEAKAAGKAAYAGAWPESAAVEGLVAELEAQAVKEARDTAAENTNEYKESERAFGAKTVLKAKGERAAKPVSYDLMAK